MDEAEVVLSSSEKVDENVEERELGRELSDDEDAGSGEERGDKEV